MIMSGCFRLPSQRPLFLQRLRSESVIRFCSSLLILLVVLVVSPLPSLAAEVLQVRSSIGVCCSCIYARGPAH